DATSDAAAMWREVHGWCQGSLERRSAYSRGLVWAWLRVDELSAARPSRLRMDAGTLWNAVLPATRVVDHDGSALQFLRQPPSDAVAIISSLWPESDRPLTAQGLAF